MAIWIPPAGVGLLLLAARVRLVIARLVRFYSSIRFPWSGSGGQDYVSSRVLAMALRASLLVSSSLRKLRSSISRVYWFSWTTFGQWLGLYSACWMVHRVVTLHACFVWIWFRILRMYLACRPSEVGRVDRLLGMIRKNVEVMAPFIGWLSVLLMLVFGGTRLCSAGLALGCLP